ncbi:hypothetical protein H0H92_004739 [Tricholoma furcatifolium]|nr:hypothetical protein H0H92_004739 [Tricholoma furcatifolium]
MAVNRTRGPSLPVELQYQIIEHLRKDRKSLAACSLVSSQWFGSAREFFFSGFTARIRHTYYLDFHRKFTTFLQLLEAPHSSLGQYIRRLDISGPDDSSIVTRKPQGSAELYDVFSKAMQKLLPHLQHISELTLQYITWHCVSQNARTQFASLSEVVYLRYEQVTCDRLHELILFSGNFPRLKRLATGGIYTKGSVALPSDRPMFFQPPKFASLRYLKLWVKRSTLPFVHALRTVIVHMHTIDTLDLLVSVHYLHHVEPLLRVIAPTLSFLTLCIDGLVEGHLFPLSLGDNVNLKKVHFRNSYPSGSMLWLNDILSSTSNIPGLEEIHILFGSTKHICVDLLSLEQTILRHRAADIKVVLVCESEEVYRILLHSMPALSICGRLSVIRR